MKNKIFYRIAIIVAAVSSLLAVNTLTVSAARMTIPRQLCSLAVYPWNANYAPIYGNDLTQWINKVAQGVCTNHVTVPSATPFSAQPYNPHNSDAHLSIQDNADIPLKSGAENKHGPSTNHSHDYYNDSLEDNYYYESFIKKFAIDFAPDTQVNINDITCETPYPPGYDISKMTGIIDCEGIVNDLWGGTEVHKTSAGVVWTFGIYDAGGLPREFGYNPSLDPLIGGGFNSGNENSRRFGANVNLTTYDVGSPTGVWSATTTSRILIRDFAILKTTDMTNLTRFCSVAGDYVNGWCSLPSSAGYQQEQVGTKYFYWFPIGSVSSVWKKALPPPPPPATCTGITLTPNDIALPGSTSYTANVVFDNGQSYPTTVQWVQANGSFLNDISQTHSSNSPFSNTYTTMGYSGSVSAQVANVTGANNSPFCQAGVTVEKTVPPPPPATCTGITLSPNTVAAPGSTGYTANVVFDNGQSYPATVEWSQTNGSFLNETSQTHSSASPFSNTYSTTQTSGSVAAKVTGVTGANNSPICQAGDIVEATPPPPATCTGIELNPNTVTAPGSTTYTARVVFDDGQSYPTTLTWSQTNGSLADSVQTQSSLSFFTNTYTTSQTSGSVSAQVTNVTGANNSPICQAGDIVEATPPPPPPECQEVTLYSNKPVPLNENESAILQALGTITDGRGISEMQWTTTSGTLTGYSPVAPQFCSQSGTNITLPSICSVLFSGGPEQTTVSVASVWPAPGNNPACKKSITVVNKPQKPWCDKLLLWPNQLNTDRSTTLRATVIFSDRKFYNTTVEWNGTYGEFSSRSTTQTQTSANDFINTFLVTDPYERASARVRVTAVDGADIGNCGAGESIISSPVTPECKSLKLNCSNGNCCADIKPPDYKGNIKWTIGGNDPYLQRISNTNCVNVGTDTEVQADVTDNCRDQLTTTAPPPPKLYKDVKVSSSGKDYNPVLTIPPQTETQKTTLQYRIRFVPGNNQTVSATIVDNISSGINAETRPTLNLSSGYVSYNSGSMSITQNGQTLDHCSKDITENCWEAEGTDISDGSIYLIKVSGQVTVTYAGTINKSKITQDICKEGKICQEKYTNTAHARNIRFFDSNGNSIGSFGDISSNQVLVQIFCQYILTRASGDIYLETDLNAGVDIRQCSKYTSTTGLIIMPSNPTAPGLVSTGTSSILSINHEICTAGQSGSIDAALKPFYGQTVSEHLSSQICEVKLVAGQAWQQSAITNDIMANKTRISRWEPDVDNTGASPGTITLRGLISQVGDKSVYHVKNTNLVIDQPYTLADGDGAKTFIIENGDLKINSDIKYGACTIEKQPCNVNDIASLAFIVLNGNTIVSPEVEVMSGVYFIQGECPSGTIGCGVGALRSVDNQTSTKQLTVYGSIYGDIEPLFESRIFSGAPSEQNAGILIRFDERVILNTPPGLRDVLNLTQTEVAR